MYLYKQPVQYWVLSTTQKIIFKPCNQSYFNTELFVTSLIKLSKNFAIAFVILILLWLCICTGNKLAEYYSLIVANDRNAINQNPSNQLENAMVSNHLSLHFYSNE